MHSFKTEMASIIFCLFSVCLTEEGGLFDSSAFGEFCVFPFRYNGIVYNSCTYVDSKRGAQGPWCSTKTNR